MVHNEMSAGTDIFGWWWVCIEVTDRSIFRVAGAASVGQARLSQHRGQGREEPDAHRGGLEGRVRVTQLPSDWVQGGH